MIGAPLLATDLEFKISLPTREQVRDPRPILYLVKPIEKPKLSHEALLLDILEFDLDHVGVIRKLAQNRQIDSLMDGPLSPERVSALKSKLGDAWLLMPSFERGNLVLRVVDLSMHAPYEHGEISLSFDAEKDALALRKSLDRFVEEVSGVKSALSRPIFYSREEDLAVFESRIWKSHYDGRFAKALSPLGEYAVCPVACPKSRDSFLYVSYRYGIPKLFLQKGDKQSEVSTLRGHQILPALSAQGTHLAFISDAPGEASLFLQSFDLKNGACGKALQLFAMPGSVQASPSFSPDGSQVAFVSDHSGAPRIYLLSIEERLTSRQKAFAAPLGALGSEQSCPSFSPDGKKLAYSARVNGVRQILIHDAESRSEIQLTDGPEDKENPTWAENSIHLIYNTTCPTYDLWMIDLVSKTPLKLTQGGGRFHYPYWEKSA